MLKKCLKIWLLLLLATAGSAGHAQKIIEYVAGMGTRDPLNPDVWILYQKVKARHEGMTLFADSASYDTRNNTFNAYRNVKIVLTDTTTLYGEYAFYDGTSRVAVVQDDTVRLVDGKTILKTDLLSYDRNTSTASYDSWGHTVHESSALDSRKGYYHSDTRDLFLYGDVLLCDSNSRLITDTLHYNTRTELAVFTSPTHIYSDSSTVYSELGNYNTGSHQACSFRASTVTDRQKKLLCDTLFFNDRTEFGQAFGHVAIFDSLNQVTCYGRVGETNQDEQFSFVTDSALIIYVDKGDSLFMHADSIWAFNNSDREFEAAKAHRNVYIFRRDVQGRCDSVFYSRPDSSMAMYHNPVVWYNSYQCSADTITAFMDSIGVRLIELRGNVFTIEEVDTSKYNQIKGHDANVYCSGREPRYADILGSARMVYYVLDEESSGQRSLIGVNAGVGSDMRIYFKDRKASRVVTYGNPDMKMYPPDALPAEERRLPGFNWNVSERPLAPDQVFPQHRLQALQP